MLHGMSLFFLFGSILYLDYLDFKFLISAFSS